VRRAFHGEDEAPPGEGGALLVLERAESAAARGVVPRARLLGEAFGFGEGAASSVVAAALRRARLAPAEVRGALGPAQYAATLARLLPEAQVTASEEALGDLGPGSAALDAALAVEGGRWPAVVLARGPSGGAGALVFGGP